MLVPVLLDVINIRDSCRKSGQKIWPEPDLPRFAKKARSAEAGAKIRYVPSFLSIIVLVCVYICSA